MRPIVEGNTICRATHWNWGSCYTTSTNQLKIFLHYQHLISKGPPFQIASDITLKTITSLNEVFLHYQHLVLTMLWFLWKLGSIWMKMLNVISCNLNWNQLNWIWIQLNWTQYSFPLRSVTLMFSLKFQMNWIWLNWITLNSNWWNPIWFQFHLNQIGFSWVDERIE